MQRLVSSAAALVTVLALLAAFTAPPARADERSADTAGVDSTEASERGGRVRISIDASGIRVEGEGGRVPAGDDEGWVVIDDERSWEEKGTDIIRFGEGVFVAANELVRGDLVVIGGDVIVEGRVTGNVVVVGGSIRARSGAEIKGDAVVIGGGELDEDEDAIIRGERVEIGKFIPFGDIEGFPEALTQWSRWSTPFFLFVKIVLALLMLLFIPQRVRTADRHFSDSVLKAFGVGVLAAFIGLFATLIISIPLIIMILTIPFVLLLIVSWVGTFVIAWTVAAHAVGRYVADRLNFESQSSFVFVLTGTLVLSLPDLVGFGFSVAGLGPIAWGFGAIGLLVRAFVYTAGLGALVTSRFGARPVTSTP